MSFAATRFLILTLFLIQAALGQTTSNTDQLREVYQTQKRDTSKVRTSGLLFEQLYVSRPEEAFQYAKEGLVLARQLNDSYGLAKANFQLGIYFSDLNFLDSAQSHYQKALQGYKTLKNIDREGLVLYRLAEIEHFKGNYVKAHSDVAVLIEKYTEDYYSPKVLMKLYHLQGIIYQSQTRYSLGIESVLKALKLLEETEDNSYKSKLVVALGNLYHYTNNKPMAIKYFKEALVIYEAQDAKKSLANVLNNIGNSYYVLENYEEALVYLNKSLPISTAIQANNLIAITSFNIGKTLVKLGEMKEGLNYLKKSLYISQVVTGNPREEVWALVSLGNAYNQLKRPKEALFYLNQAISLSDSIEIKDDLYAAYRNRSKSFQLSGNYEMALKDHQAFHKIKEEVYNLSKTKEIERLTTVFETEKKEQQIAFQANEINLLEQKARVNTLERELLGTGLGLSLLVLLLVFYSFHQRFKRNQLEKEKLDTELSFKKKELTTHALHLAKKNEVLTDLKEKVEALKSKPDSISGYNQLIQTINFDLIDDKNWQSFTRYFEEVHTGFNAAAKEKYPKLTGNELRLLALYRMNLSSKEIARILNISQEGIKKARYRLRKKLAITPKESIYDLALAL